MASSGLCGASRSMGLAASIVLSVNFVWPVRLVCKSTSCASTRSTTTESDENKIGSRTPTKTHHGTEPQPPNLAESDREGEKPRGNGKRGGDLMVWERQGLPQAAQTRLGTVSVDSKKLAWEVVSACACGSWSGRWRRYGRSWRLSGGARRLRRRPRSGSACSSARGRASRSRPHHCRPQHLI
ncbi:hypothetical protein ABZP36_022571 [Zizania latifolia]